MESLIPLTSKDGNTQNDPCSQTDTDIAQRLGQVENESTTTKTTTLANSKDTEQACTLQKTIKESQNLPQYLVVNTEKEDLRNLSKEIELEERSLVDPLKTLIDESRSSMHKYPMTVIELLSEKISTAFGFHKTQNVLYASIGTSIAVTLFSLCKDIYISIKSKQAGVMTAAILGIISSLIALATQVATICHLMKADFNVKNAISHITEVVEPTINGIEPHEELTAWDRFKGWIPRIITFLCTTVAAGLSLLPKGSVISTIVSNYGNSKKIGEDISSTLSNFLTDVVGISLEGDPKYVDALVKLNAEGVKLLTTPMHIFHIDFKEREKLISYPRRIDEATLHKTDTGTFRTLKMTLQSLQATRNQVVQRIQELNDSSQRTIRQEPIGISLAGMGGIGKSYFAKELAKALHKENSYHPDIYSIDKAADNFYEPYKGESVAIANEFMSRRAEHEPLLRDINKICSEDYFNLEGASLHTKNQPCHFKVVVLTSNVVAPCLNMVQSPTVTEAMWSRFRRFHVVDSRFKTAEEARTNVQKLEKNSRFLTFKEYTADHNSNVHYIKDWTAQEVIDYCVKTTREKEMIYLQKIVNENPYKLDEEGIKAIRERISVLEGLVPSSKEGRVFVCRLEGPPGTGKSYFLEKRLIPTLLNTFPQLELVRWHPKRDFDYDKFSLVVVDDTLEDNEKEYFEMVRHLNHRSIVVICTNTTTEATLDWTSATIGRLPIVGSPFAWAPSIKCELIPGLPSGFFRRIGLGERISVGKYTFEPFNSDVAHYRFFEGFIIKKTRKSPQLAQEVVEDEIVEKYISYLQDAGDFTWSEKRLNIVDPTVRIKARSYKDMVEVLSGSTGMMSLVSCFQKSGTNNPDPRMEIFLDEQFMRMIFNRAGADEWRVPDRPMNGRTRLHIAEKISSFLRKFKPDATVVVQIDHPELDDENAEPIPHMYELKGNMGYYSQSATLEIKPQVTYNDHGVRFHATNSTVTYDECAIIQDSENPPPGYDPIIVRMLKQNLVQDPRLDHARMVYNRRANLRAEMQTQAVLSFFSHPAVLALTAIITALVIGGIVYGIYRACVASCGDEDDLTPCDDSADYRDGKYREIARAALRKGSPPKNKSSYKEFIETTTQSKIDSSLEKELNDYFFSLPGMEPFSEEVKQLPKEVQQTIAKVFKQSATVPTTVRPDQEVKPHLDPKLSNLLKKVTKNLLTVTGNGTNYALVFENDLVVTTGHTVHGLDNVLVESDEFTGIARVVRTDVARDIALLKLSHGLDGSRPPQFPSLRRYFLMTNANMEGLAWYVKPFPNKTIFVCGKMITSPSYTCVSSHISESFNPSEWIITFFQHQMTWSPTLFQRGECGLPLFIEVEGNYKIAGIFNAANQFKHVTFASVVASDFNHQKGLYPSSDEPATQVVEYKTDISPNGKFVANTFVAEVLDEVSLGFVTHQEAPYPQPIGHCTKLRAHSYPEHKAFPLYPPGTSVPGGIPNTQRLSCVSESLLPPGLKVPRRTKFNSAGERRPAAKEPLFLQIQKYNTAPGFTADKALFAEAVKETIHSYRLRLKLGAKQTCNLLTIKQAINGLSKGSLHGFNRKTGAGPTLAAKYNIHSKEKVLTPAGPELPVYVLSEDQPGRYVKAAVSEKLSAILTGTPIVMLTKSCKKVEKIDEESWKKGKVRLFTECDFEDNILLKMLFGDLQNRLAEAKGTPLLLNLNPYTMPSIVAELLGHNFDDAKGTDISSMDKHFPRELIAAFVQVAGDLYGWHKQVQRAIAATLMYPLQNFEGDVYLSFCGNLSGWFPTTLLNCVAQELIIAYDRLKNLSGPRPFNILSGSAEPYAILGDDKFQRMTESRAKSQEQSYLECGLIMQAGSKLQAKDERFCSRTFYKEDGVYYGELKISAISGLLYYTTDSTLEAIIPNFSLALFEAALHRDPQVYLKTLITIEEIANKYDIVLDNLASRDHYRLIYRNYVSGITNVLNFCGHRPDILSVLETSTMNKTSRSILNEYAQVCKLDPPSYSYKVEGPSHAPTFTVSLSFANQLFEGSGGSKTSASEAAAEAAVKKLGVEPKMNPAKREIQKIVTKHEAYVTTTPTGYEVQVFRDQDQLKVLMGTFFRKSKSSARRAAESPAFEILLESLVENLISIIRPLNAPVVVWHSTDNQVPLKKIQIEGTSMFIDESGTYYLANTVLQQFPYSKVIGALEAAGCAGIPKSQQILYKPPSGPCSDDVPIQPSDMTQVPMNTGAMTIPQISNPQPGGQAISMAPPAQKIVSATEAISTETLNPLGPPNMLATGAVVFDIKDLIYSQFLDCDQQFVITDDTPAGSVLLQIPYDPEGQWVNPYIRQYVSQHERYTGSLLFRITIVGNPTFSGLIGVAWQPRKVSTSTVNISEMQKYSYYGVTVELPSNKVIVLNDARQDKFWRSTSDKNDIDERPHLVVFTLLSLVSPLREGIQTRLRIASKLSNGGIDDGIGRNAFQVSLPITNNNKVGRSLSSNDSQLSLLVPSFRNKRVFLYTDGPNYGSAAPMFDPSERYNKPLANFGSMIEPIAHNNTQSLVQRRTIRFIKDATTLNFSARTNTGSLVGTQGSLDRNMLFVDEVNNLPISVYNSVLEKVFADLEITTQPDLSAKLIVERLTKPETYAGNDLLGIYVGAEGMALDSLNINRQELQEPQYQANQNTYFWAVFNQAKGLGRGTAIKLLFKTGVMYVFINEVTVESSVTANSISMPAVSTVLSETHQCANNPIWKSPSMNRPQHRFPRWNGEFEAVPVTVSFLPAGWCRVVISELAPTVIVPQIRSPTAHLDKNFSDFLASRSEGIDTYSCITFDLLDSVSSKRIATCRYLQESQTLVLHTTVSNSATQYSAYPADISNAVVSNFGIISRSNAFTQTNMDGWLARNSSAELASAGIPGFKETDRSGKALLDEFFGKPETSDFTPCASMAAMMALSIGGGAISGIGQGMQSVADRKHELNKQERNFEFMHLRDSNNHNYDLERMMKNFNYQTQLSEQAFRHREQLSDRDFQHRERLQSHELQHREKMQSNHFRHTQSMAYASSPSSTLLQGSHTGSTFA